MRPHLSAIPATITVLAASTLLSCGGGSTGGNRNPGGVLFQNDVESAASCTEIYPNGGVDCYGGGECSVSTTVAHSGTRAVRLTYPVDEAGCTLAPPAFAPTQTLFIRKFEYFDTGWEHNWPLGLKTSRYFSRDDWSLGPDPNNSSAYTSEKLIDNQYPENTCHPQFALGLNNAIGNLDLWRDYSADDLFGNGLPYIRTAHWYKFETWLVMNSAIDAPDGVMQVWIDDVLVYDNHSVAYRSAVRGMPYGSAWQSMWFGGNYTNGACAEPNPSVKLFRYVDDFYLSTTLDR